MLGGLSLIGNTSKRASKPDQDIGGVSRLVTLMQLHLCIHSLINVSKAGISTILLLSLHRPINAYPTTITTILQQTRIVVQAEVANDGDILVATTYETARAVNGWRFRNPLYIR
jgi:hypothetical protein